MTANLFADDAPPPEGERFDVLLSQRNLVVERIVSSGRIDTGEYAQSQDEWVVLLRGEAEVEVAGEVRRLGVGDHCFLPAGTPHRVRSVTEGAIWLAVHLHPYDPDG